MKTLFKVLIVGAFLPLFAACSDKNTTGENASTTPSASTSSTASSPNTSSSPEAASAPTAAASPAATAASGATKINVTETEMAIKLSQTTAPAGPIEFVVKNGGAVTHEFVVLKASVPDAKLPLKAGKLDEEGKGVKHVAEISEDDLKSGASKTLTTKLTPGRYVLICNVDDHFKQGMKADFTVK